ncbi:MAG: folate-binding protein [Burkholderiales bacterium]
MVTDSRWCKITSSALLRFEGPDAQAFLQGQLTNTVQALTSARSQYSGYCTAKGRLLACLLLWQHDGAYFALLPREIGEPIRKRLSMYILRAKVKATDVSVDHVCFGVAGADAAQCVSALAGAAPANVHDARHEDGVSILKLPVNRYLVAAAAAKAPAIERALTQCATVAAESLWSQLDIEAGIPTIVAATQEQFVPQTVNFDFIDALSFDKGCYPGQEIVARTHYLGKSKQRMVRAHVDSADVPHAGDKLYSEAFGDQASGMIVSAVSSNAHKHDVLAVVQTSSIEKEDVHWKSVAGPTLKIIALPYAVK